MSFETDSDDDRIVASWFGEAGDPRVEPRAQHVLQVRQAILMKLQAGHSRRFPRAKRLVFVAGAAAAAVLMITLNWTTTPAVTWAQVVETVLTRPWVHAVESDADGERREAWWSPARG